MDGLQLIPVMAAPAPQEDKKLFNFSNTFDTTNALSGMYLWLIFGFVSTIINCDLQRFMKKYPFFMHLFALTAFIFLFTLLDSNNKTSISLILIKTFFIYILFVLMTKSKWYFVLPVLALLLIDQLMKKKVAIDEAAGRKSEDYVKIQETTSKIINIVILVTIITGTIHYVFLQRREYGKNFSWFNFFFGITRCKDT